jgi:hypothetical protein
MALYSFRNVGEGHRIHPRHKTKLVQIQKGGSNVRRDQDKRDDTGQYSKSGTRPYARLTDDEALDNLVQCRVTNRELRLLMILFDQHRAQFGWQTKSDMMRELMGMGMIQASLKLKKKDPELTARLEQFKELNESAKRAMRHTELDQALEQLEKDVVTLTRAGDLWAVRENLREFQQRTDRIPDKVIQARREDEFERRWGRMLEELERGHSLKPKK